MNLIEGNKRHTSIHAAGIVISREPLSDILPIKKGEDISKLVPKEIKKCLLEEIVRNN